MRRKKTILTTIGINKLLPKIHKPAASPGTVKYIGRKREAPVKLQLIRYNETEYVEEEKDSLPKSMEGRKEGTITWLNITGVHNEKLIRDIGEEFQIHPLVLEDIANTTQIPKVEEFEDYLFIVLKMAYFDEAVKEVVMEQLSLVVGADYVILLQEREGDILDGIRERLRLSKGKIRRMGSDYLMYAIIDAVIDHFFHVLARLGEEIELMEEELVDSANKELLVKIYRMKRELVFLRKAIWPLREVASTLYRAEHPLIKESTNVFLRDVYDHTIQVVETVETFRDMASGMLDLYISTNSNKMNEIMKVLTIFAAIFIPLTFIAGVYGMNFEFMPELHHKLAYPIWWGVTISLGIGLLILFKWKKWL